MAVSMSRVFATAAVFAIAGGVRVDEDAHEEVGTTKKASTLSGCSSTTTTTTTCVGADCVNKYWPWHKDATIGGVPVKEGGEKKEEKKEEKRSALPEAAPAGLLQQSENGIDLVSDLKQFGRDVEYEATHLSGEDGAPAPVLQKHAAATQAAKAVKKPEQVPSETAEALIDEILDGDTTTAAAEEMKKKSGATSKGKKGDDETTTAEEGETTTKAGKTTTAADGETTTAEETTTAADKALLEDNEKEAKTTTTPCPAALGDDLVSLRKRLDALPLVEKGK